MTTPFSERMMLDPAKFTGPIRAYNTCIKDDRVQVTVYKLLPILSRYMDRDQIIAFALWIVATNARHQGLSESKPSEEVAKEWGDQILALSRFVEATLRGPK